MMKKYLNKEKSMQLLKEYIEKYGIVIGENILKVDSFINHQIDANLMMEIGKNLKKDLRTKNNKNSNYWKLQE